MEKRRQLLGAMGLGCGGMLLFLWACGGDDTTGRPPAGPDCRLTPAACREAGPEGGGETGTDSGPVPDTGPKDGATDSGADGGIDSASNDSGDATDGLVDAADSG